MSLIRAEIAHQYAHDLEHNPEVTLQVALTDKDLALVTCGLELVKAMYECLMEEVISVQKRMDELVGMQKFGEEPTPEK